MELYIAEDIEETLASFPSDPARKSQDLMQNLKPYIQFKPSQRKAMAKNVQTTTQLHSSHMLVK